MVFTREQIEDAVKIFTANPFYQEMYEGAASEECKEMVELMLCYSLHSEEVDDDEYVKECDTLEARLKLEDWKHLAKYGGNNPWGAKCRAKVRELGG